MSCFIMNTNALSTLADGIEKVLNMGYRYCGISAPCSLFDALNGTCADIYGFFDAKMIFQQLYDLNAKAYATRYNEADITAHTESYANNVGILKRSEYGNGHFELCDWHYHFAKLLECYIYQVNEEETKNDPLELALEEFSQVWNNFIVHNTPIYHSFAWGE